jgi:hypothetical protein
VTPATGPLLKSAPLHGTPWTASLYAAVRRAAAGDPGGSGGRPDRVGASNWEQGNTLT